MTNKNSGTGYAILALIVLFISCILGFIPILLIGLLKLIPIKKWQTLCTKGIDSIVMLWSDINNFYITNIQKLNCEIKGLETLNPKDWYLLVANHQSWLDIVILQHVFNRKIPVLKFFIKDQLKWIPLLGFAWWAMGCPFMKRYNKQYLERKPHKRGKDLIATRKAVKSFKNTPSSIMTFLEGTRFTSEKKQLQNSPYTHLLKPKAGGISFIISSMGKQLNNLLDVTIVYGEPKHSLWDFLCKRVHSITIHIRPIKIPQHFTSSQLVNDDDMLADFKDWLNEQWAQKDNLITSLK